MVASEIRVILSYSLDSTPFSMAFPFERLKALASGALSWEALEAQELTCLAACGMVTKDDGVYRPTERLFWQVGVTQGE